MECGLLLLLLVLAKQLAVSYRNLVVGIVLGFGLYAAVAMLVQLGMSHPFTAHRWSLLRWIRAGAYVGACLIWLAYVLRVPVARDAALS